MATKKQATKATKRFDFNMDVDFNKGIKKVKEVTTDANNFVLETSEDIVEGAIKRGHEWTSVADKAVKGGLKLAETQQDLVFDTLETLKVQVLNGTKRFRVLFSKN